jgi:hypothetical protein
MKQLHHETMRQSNMLDSLAFFRYPRHKHDMLNETCWYGNILVPPATADSPIMIVSTQLASNCKRFLLKFTWISSLFGKGRTV